MSEKKAKETVAIEDIKENFIEQNISDYAEYAYLDYAMSVVKGRALPSVEDGLKPVHRRILYAMYREGMIHTSVHKKSARVVGNVLGLYHPHGDQSVYEAMVRQAQDFTVRYPLIDGQGNFGSRDGDGAASMRYTEAKLAPITQLFLDEIGDHCVDTRDNYDGSETEPVFLPARMPFILLNCNPGIAVGMASNIPSHNVKEVASAVIAMLENDKITLDDVLTHIKGPDFPTGARIVSSPAEIRKTYAEGQGSVKLRSKYKIESDKKSWKLVFYEIPYGVSVQSVMQEIDSIFNPEDKMKKDAKGKIKLSPKQLQQKLLFSNMVDSYNDGSDKDNPVRLVIQPKSSKQDPEELANLLLASTSLENNFATNYVCVGRDGRPVRKNLMEILYEWIDFRLITIRRRVEHHLMKIAERLHILEGRKIVLNHIDEVIQIIKTSENPREDLIKRFELSEKQANDVLDLKLRQLGNLELKNIEKEMNDLLKKQDELRKIIATEKSLKKQMIKEMTADIEKFGDDRLTEILEAEKLDLVSLQEKGAKVAEEEITLAISEKAWVKVFKGRKNLEEISFKEGDKASYHFYCKNTDTLCIFDIEGKVYNYPLNELGKDGAPISTLAQLGAKFSLACPIHKDFKYVMVQDKGLGFIVTGENLSTRMKAGKEMFKDVSESTILQPLYFANSEDTKNYYMGVITTENRFLTYKLSEVSEMGKSKGIVLCGLQGEFKIKEVRLLREKEAQFDVKNKNGKVSAFTLKDEEFSKMVKGRSTKGNFLPIKDKACEISFTKKPEDTTQKD